MDVKARYLDAPPRLNQTWKWFCALCAFDYDDAAPLAELVRNQDVPGEYRQAVANIVAGIRKPNKRAGAKLKIPAAEMMKLAGTVSVVIDLAHAIKYEAIQGNDDELRGAAAIGNDKGLEPVDVLRDCEHEARKALCDAANEFNVSVETIENAVRELRRRIAAWPDV